jgi:hypothetical protein
LSGTDIGSGVAAIGFQLNGLPDQVKAGEVVTVTADGTHTLLYHALDVAGRQSPTQTLTMR